MHLRGYVPNAGFHKSPDTIDVSASSHQLETTTKAEKSRISVFPLKKIDWDERHVAHEVCAVMTSE